MKKFAFIQNQRIPNEYAFGIYTIQTCQASQKIGYQTYLIHPDKKQNSEFLQKNTWDFYKIKKNYFTEIKIKIREFCILPKYFEFIIKHFRWQIQTWDFVFKTIEFLKKEKIQIVQTTCRELIFLLKFSKKYKPTVIYDVHVEPRTTYEKIFDKLIIKRINLLLTNTKFYKNFYINKGIKKEDIIILPSGFDNNQFKPKDKFKTRKELLIPTNKFIIGFIGRFSTFSAEKGIEEMLKAVKNLKAKIPISALIVGGPKKLVEKYQRIANVYKLTKNEAIILNQVKPNEVPNYISAFDIACMLYPNTHHYKDKMSPQKAVEYMAMKKCIITTNLLSIKELIPKDYAYFISPISQKEFENTILEIYKNKSKSQQKAQNAFNYVQQYSWINRQKVIFDKINLL